MQRLACIVMLAVAGQAAAQGYPPLQAAKRMTVPAGFHVELVACEPEIRQPVAIDFDERGRLWVMQYLQYPNPAGLKRVKVDRYSRTAYDRIPEPPPKGPKGADRLTILQPIENQPGKYRAKDFVNGLNLASGFAFGHDGVFILQTPYLLFYPDRDRDDVPDSDPEVLLSGFGMEDAHSVANSLTWGPDGWLYGCQGSTVTAKIRNPARPDDSLIEFQQGVWRYHPLTRRFELFCEGGGNSWGLDFDRDGHLFYSTNVGGHVLLHGVQGGYYWKSFGKHGNLHNPYAYGYFEHALHQNFKGGHVTVGGLVYQGNAYPAEFRGKYIAADLLGHAMYWHDILPDGSTFRTRHGGELLLANDTWFAPSDLALGPDGCVYVADWHDQRTAHPDPDAEWDRRNGRVYRIAHANATPQAATDLGQLSSAELVKLLDHPNAWYSRTARRLLAARRDPDVILPLRTRVMESKDSTALNALWALYVSGGFNEAFGCRLLEHPTPMVRYWAVRLLGDEPVLSGDAATRFALLASAESHLPVICQLASTARRLHPTGAMPIVYSMMKRKGIERDPYVSLLLWWAIESHLPHDPNQWLPLFSEIRPWDAAPVISELAPRAIRRLLSVESDNCWRVALRLWQLTPVSHRKSLLAVVESTLEDKPPISVSENSRELWIKEIGRDIGVGGQDTSILRIGVRLLNKFCIAQAWNECRDEKLKASERVLLIRAVAAVDSERVWYLISSVQPAEPIEVQIAAIDALQRLKDIDFAHDLLERYAKLAPLVRQRLRGNFLARPAWAIAFLQAVNAGRIPAKDISIEELRPLAASADEKTKALIRKHWGALPVATPEEKLAEVRRLNNDLRAGTGDAKTGRALFKQHCAACHKLFDEGVNVGPDLTHANRLDRDYLLVSIVDPSAIIRREFMTHVAQTKDGRSLSGLIVEQSPSGVTLFTPSKERVAIASAQIDEMNPTDVSLMPENLLKALKPQELRDLFAFLQAKTAPPP